MNEVNPNMLQNNFCPFFKDVTSMVSMCFMILVQGSKLVCAVIEMFFLQEMKIFILMSFVMPQIMLHKKFKIYIPPTIKES